MVHFAGHCFGRQLNGAQGMITDTDVDDFGWCKCMLCLSDLFNSKVFVQHSSLAENDLFSFVSFISGVLIRYRTSTRYSYRSMTKSFTRKDNQSIVPVPAYPSGIRESSTRKLPGPFYYKKGSRQKLFYCI